MNYRFRPGARKGVTKVLPSDTIQMKWTDFSLLRLAKGESHTEACGAREVAVVMLSGTARVKGAEFDEVIGGRKSVFEGPGACAFWGRGQTVSVTAETDCEIALTGIEATADAPGFVVKPEDVNVIMRGSVPFEREVRNMIVDGQPASRLVLGETINASGQWSSYPPHKHEIDDPPHEVNMEEVYYFRVDPAQGFGFIWLYTDDRSLDDAYAIEDQDVVALPKGYHPVSAAPGYKVYYLWIMAGATSRTLTPRDDPKHAWVKNMK